MPHVVSLNKMKAERKKDSPAARDVLTDPVDSREVEPNSISEKAFVVVTKYCDLRIIKARGAPYLRNINTLGCVR